MEIRYYLDETGDPHTYAHSVSESEAQEALAQALETIRGQGTTRIAIGQTRSGRYLKVIYSPDENKLGILIITAYDVPPRQVRALRRRVYRRRR